MLKVGLRELGRARGRAVLVGLILALQAAALGGGFLAFDSLFHTRDVIYERLNFADLEVQFVPAAEEELPTLEQLRGIPGVASVTRRFMQIGYMESAGSEPYPVLVQYLDPEERPTVNALEIQEGQFLVPGQPEHAVVDRSFRYHQPIQLGDKLVVNPNRFTMRFTVQGVALSPEFLVPTANPDILIPSKGSLGIIYASREQLDALFVERLYNNLAFRFTPGVDAEATKNHILQVLGKLDIERVVPRQANFGYRYVEEALGGGRLFMPLTAMILAFLASIVTFITVSRIIAMRRRELGAMLAQGFPAWHFVVGLSLIGLVPGLLGGLLGSVGAIFYGKELAVTNADIAGFPPPMMQYAPESLAIATLSAVVVGVLSSIIPVLRVLRMQPAEALRGGSEIRFSGLPRPLEALIALAGSPVRFALRNLFRRPYLSLATVLLICLSVAMPASMMTLLASWDTWAREHTAKQPWDAATTFKVPLKAETFEPLVASAGLSEFEPYTQGYATMHREGLAPQEMRVRGIPVPSRLKPLEIVEGQSFSAPDAMEVILNRSFAKNMPPPRLGETVTLVSKGVSHQLRVVGVVSDLSLLTLFVPQTTAQRILGFEGKVSGAYVMYGDAAALARADKEPEVGTRPEEAEVIELPEEEMMPVDPGVEAPAALAPASPKERLIRNEMVSSVQSKAELGKAMVDYMGAFRVILIPFIGIGVTLAFLFLLSVLGFLLLERESEYATLRSMGYGGRELSQIIYTEVGILSVVGLLASVPAWVGLSLVFRDLMATAWFSIDLDLRPLDFYGTAIPTFIFLLVAALPGVRQLLRMNISSSIRARAIG